MRYSWSAAGRAARVRPEVQSAPRLAPGQFRPGPPAPASDRCTPRACGPAASGVAARQHDARPGARPSDALARSARAGPTASGRVVETPGAERADLFEVAHVGELDQFESG